MLQMKKIQACKIRVPACGRVPVFVFMDSY